MSWPRRTNSHSAPRELACRVSDGLRVLLLWDPADGGVSVAVADERTGHRIECPVDRERALDAFYHPSSNVG
jgi:hypothetical protein